jgi:ABC-type amino acid transport substrate-binding protein
MHRSVAAGHITGETMAISRRKFFGAASALVAIAASPAGRALAQKAPKKITAGINTVGVPFAYRENDAFKGVMYDMLEAIAKLEGFSVEYSPMKFDAMIPALQVNQIDLGVTGFFVTDARREIIDFTTSIFKQGSVLVVNADSPISSVEGLRGKVIAAQQGSAPLKVAQSHAGEWGVEVRILSDAANMMLAMQTGDVAGMIYDSAVIKAHIKKEGDHPSRKIISGLLNPTEIAYGVPKGGVMLGVMNDGLAALKASGQFDAIMARYDL